MPLIADRRYSGTDGLVVAIYVIISTGIAVYGDMLLAIVSRPTGKHLGNCSKGLYTSS